MGQNMRFLKYLTILAVIGVVSLVAVAHAGILISDLGDPRIGTSAGSVNGYPYLAQGVNLPGGTIDSLTGQFSVTAAAGEGQQVNVYLYTANSSGVPLSQSLLLGTITTGNSVANAQLYTLTPVANSITAGNYAIVADIASSSVGFDYTTTATTGFSGGNLSANGSTGWISEPGYYAMMSIDVVPEPITQALLVFGSVALLVCLGRRVLLRFQS